MNCRAMAGAAKGGEGATSARVSANVREVCKHGNKEAALLHLFYCAYMLMASCGLFVSFSLPPHAYFSYQLWLLVCASTC